MNVEQFATELKVEPALLIKQLQAAGVTVKGATDALSDTDNSLLLDYLRGNARAVENAVAKISGLAMHPVEATYLAWIDAREFAQ